MILPVVLIELIVIASSESMMDEHMATSILKNVWNFSRIIYCVYVKFSSLMLGSTRLSQQLETYDTYPVLIEEILGAVVWVMCRKEAKHYFNWIRTKILDIRYSKLFWVK